MKRSDGMNFLFVCGGTAGHINPALATAAAIRRRVPHSKVLFVGAGRELEKRLIPREGFHLINIRMSGLKRGFSPEEIMYNMKTVRSLVTAGIKAGKLIRRFQPDAVIGTGGYICFPILRKAARMGIPTVIHEPNAVPGLTTKMLSAIVDKVLVSFPGLEMEYRHPERVIFTGTPVRVGFEVPPQELETQEKKKTPLVVSFWGSLGAERMNEAIAEFIKHNIEGQHFRHIHATGKKGGTEEMMNRLKRLGVDGDLPQCTDIRGYIDDMPTVMAAADVVLCRAGASTIAELTMLRKPSVLVPSPYVTNNHQEKNASQLQNVGGAIMLLEKECSGQALFKTVSSILYDSEKLESMSHALEALSAPHAADRIAEIIVSLC